MSAMPIIIGFMFLAMFLKDLEDPKPPKEKDASKSNLPNIVISYQKD